MQIHQSYIMLGKAFIILDNHHFKYWTGDNALSVQSLPVNNKWFSINKYFLELLYKSYQYSKDV